MGNSSPVDLPQSFTDTQTGINNQFINRVENPKRIEWADSVVGAAVTAKDTVGQTYTVTKISATEYRFDDPTGANPGTYDLAGLGTVMGNVSWEYNN